MKKSLLYLVFGCLSTLQFGFAQCISVQPNNTSICETVGSTASVSIGASGASYAWQFRVVTAAAPNPNWITITSSNAGAIYSNYNTATLGITKANAVLPKKGTEYRAIVSGGACGTATSSSAGLTIIEAVKPGTIVSSGSVCAGSDITFSVSGYSGSSIQWESSPLSNVANPGTFTPIPGETNPYYIIGSATQSIDRSYRVVVSNDVCGTTATTPVKTIKVDEESIGGTIIGGGTMCSASSRELKLTGYKGKIEWQFSKNGFSFDKAPNAGENKPSNAFSTTSVNNSSVKYVVANLHAPVYFRAMVINGLCSVAYSNVVRFAVGNEAIMGTVSVTHTTVCPGVGTTIDLSDANGYVTWEKSKNWTLATPTWTATTNHTLTVNLNSLSVPVAYRAKVTVGECVAESTLYSDPVYIYPSVAVVAKPIKANITSPSGTTSSSPICTSSYTKVLTITSGYSGAIQWQVSNPNIDGYLDIDGQTGVSYTVTGAVPGLNYYRVKFTNDCGSIAYSAPMNLYYTDCGSGKTASFSATKTFDASVYPNPFTQGFNLNVTSSSQENTTIKVYDITGRLIEQRTTATDSGLEQLGSQYPTGIYNVIVTQGENVKTLRVIKR